MANADLTAARLRELLHYDPDTGVVTWKVRPSPIAGPGDRAGSVLNNPKSKKQYRRIQVAGRIFFEHRLIWALHYGEWPDEGMDIDHLNGDGLDNRIINLRLASRSMNRQNLRRAHRDSKTGFLGVTLSRGRFHAHIKIDGRLRYIGSFETPELAHTAYVEAKRVAHPGCTI